jgi:hypothetical protein
VIHASRPVGAYRPEVSVECIGCIIARSAARLTLGEDRVQQPGKAIGKRGKKGQNRNAGEWHLLERQPQLAPQRCAVVFHKVDL